MVWWCVLLNLHIYVCGMLQVRKGFLPHIQAHMRRPAPISISRRATHSDIHAEKKEHPGMNPYQPPLPSIPTDINEKYNIEDSYGIAYTSPIKRYQIFDKQPDEGDVGQRFLANCAMLAAFTSIAALRPDILESAILDYSNSFQVRLHHQGQIVRVPLDKAFPRVFYARSKTPGKSGVRVQLTAVPRRDRVIQIMWPLILEKAFAVLKRGYDGLINIESAEVLNTVIGQTYTNSDCHKKLNPAAREEFWKSLVDNGIPTVLHIPCNFPSKDPHRLKNFVIMNDGSADFHAYGLLGYKYDENGNFMLLIRNPHESVEKFDMFLDEVHEMTTTIALPKNIAEVPSRIDQTAILAHLDKMQHHYLNMYS